MTRAMRVDKLTLAALAATLRLYRDPDKAQQKIPLLMMLSTPVENLKLRAERLAPQLAEASFVETAEAVTSQSTLGGGSLPTQYLPTWCIALTPNGCGVDELARKLRTNSPAIFGRITSGQLLLDLRTVAPRHDTTLVDTIVGARAQEEIEAEPVPVD